MTAVRSLDEARQNRSSATESAWWQTERLVLTADLPTLADACTPGRSVDRYFRCPSCSDGVGAEILSPLDWRCRQCGPASRLDLAHIVLRDPLLRSRIRKLREDDR